jgi:hypothetical protein
MDGELHHYKVSYLTLVVFLRVVMSHVTHRCKKSILLILSIYKHLES